MSYAHLFRRDGTTHVVVSKAKTPPSRRSGRYFTQCEVPLGVGFQQLSLNPLADKVTPITCDECLQFVIDTVDEMEVSDGNHQG